MFPMSVIFFADDLKSLHCAILSLLRYLSLEPTMQFSHCAEEKQVKTRTSPFNKVLFVAAALGNDVSFEKFIKSFVCRGEKMG